MEVSELTQNKLKPGLWVIEGYIVHYNRSTWGNEWEIRKNNTAITTATTLGGVRRKIVKMVSGSDPTDDTEEVAETAEESAPRRGSNSYLDSGRDAEITINVSDDEFVAALNEEWRNYRNFRVSLDTSAPPLLWNTTNGA